jgi:hemoglobin-like flavoprotein
MLQDLGYTSIAKVLESWELSRQKYGSVEESGMMIMLNLFNRAPETKVIFGFQENDEIETSPKLRMRLMVHGTAMFRFLDSILALLGPDTDTIADVMAGLGKRHEKLGVKKEHFPLLGLAIRDSLSKIMVGTWTPSIDEAWKDVFDELSEVMVKEMS